MRAAALFMSGSAIPLEAIPSRDLAAFRESLLAEARRGSRLLCLFQVPVRGSRSLLALLGRDGDGSLAALLCDLEGAASYPALTPEWPQAHMLERWLWESHNITPEGHPWLKPLVFPDQPCGSPIPRAYPYFSANGHELHEVAVGPVHAGVIEPGHFRFQCRGEEVLHLEIQLGYQHRGLEALLLGAAPEKRLALAESLAGDTAVGHATAWCAVEEALAGIEPPPRAQAMRAIALELERLANHTGDLGALAGDVGYLPAASYFGGLRGDFLNLTARLCGNRFGRGLLARGGVRPEISSGEADVLRVALRPLAEAFARYAGLLFGAASVQSRFEGTGPVSAADAETLGMVGVAGRASGCARDARRDHPQGYYRFAQVTPQLLTTGDVYARAMVRRLEVERSLQFLEEHLASLPAGASRSAVPPARPSHLSAVCVEGWRGELVHAAVTDEEGKLAALQVVDPSLRNWAGLALALRGQAISDFPLCNKSFNLSYAGHDR